mgnify:CR=1 FL=1
MTRINRCALIDPYSMIALRKIFAGTLRNGLDSPLYRYLCARLKVVASNQAGGHPMSLKDSQQDRTDITDTKLVEPLQHWARLPSNQLYLLRLIKVVLKLS